MLSYAARTSQKGGHRPIVRHEATRPLRQNRTFVPPGQFEQSIAARTPSAFQFSRRYVFNTSSNARLGLGPVACSATPKRNAKVGSQPADAANLAMAGPKSSRRPNIALRSMH